MSPAGPTNITIMKRDILSGNNQNDSIPSFERRQQGIHPGKGQEILTWSILLFSMGLTVAAVGIKSAAGLIFLTGLNLIFGLLLRVNFSALARELKFFFFQTGLLLFLYLLRFGYPDGVWPAVQVSWRICLAFVPGTMVFKSLSFERISGTLNRLLPRTTVFVLVTSIRFIPLLKREFSSIYEAQILRGARIRKKDLMNPKSWSDFIHCLLVPCIVQGMKISGEIALAARIRGLGKRKGR